METMPSPIARLRPVSISESANTLMSSVVMVAPVSAPQFPDHPSAPNARQNRRR
jgi:hypothetical protein